MRFSPRTIDAVLVVGVAAAMVLSISVADEPESRSPTLLAYGLGVGVAALLPLWRRWPMGVLVGSAGLLFVYYGLDYPAFSPAVPLAVAAYLASLSGHLAAAATLVGGIVLSGVGWQTIGEDEEALSVLGQHTLADVALLAAVLILGQAVRNRRAWANEVAERRVEEERLRIARELHDVMAHTIAALNVQAGVAADVMDDAPDQAKAALRTIREQSRQTMRELEATVGLLRGGGEPPTTPAPGLAGLDALAESVEAAGVHVDVSVSGTVRPLPAAIDLTAYRIVQESLTNVVRHAQASTTSVQVRFEPDAVELEVTDDGRGGNGAGGFGLAGMRERAAALGGTLAAGTTTGGGFRVHARLPTDAGAP